MIWQIRVFPIAVSVGHSRELYMNAPRTLDQTILREYDIRGIVGDTLNRDDAIAIGRALARC